MSWFEYFGHTVRLIVIALFGLTILFPLLWFTGIPLNLPEGAFGLPGGTVKFYPLAILIICGAAQITEHFCNFDPENKPRIKHYFLGGAGAPIFPIWRLILLFKSFFNRG